jgi:thiol-disulfide isomerase/thioredoxin
MRKIFVTTLLTLLGLQASLSAAEGWMTDYNAAKAQAVAENKPLLLDFTGSDWCPPCMMLEREVFSKKAFLDFAEENLILVKLDFPRGKDQPAELKAQNEALAQRYQIEGFPTVMIFSPEGQLIERETGYRRGGAESYIEYVKEVLASAE